MNVSVYYWKYETGKPEEMPEYMKHIYPTGFKHSAPKGWHCWAYPNNDREFEEWMTRICPTAEFTYRFNSGDPMYTIYITNDEEATSFKLQWM